MPEQGDGDRSLSIVGAGPAGLGAAITAARAGVRTTVYERRREVGGRFHGDFEGLENWTTHGDVLDELAAAGIEPTFDHTPFTEQVCYGPDGREHVFRSREPFYYLVRRGPEPGTLDHALEQQALAAGVELRFGEARDRLPEGGIVAQGPRGAQAIAVGYVFHTDRSDGAFAALGERLAPGGYAYLLIQGGRGTVASCMFAGFHEERRWLDNTVEFFERRVGLEMREARRFGGAGNFMLPRSAARGALLLVGESAGFQDPLWGFGIRSALLSGHLAARSFLDGEPESYDRFWRARLAGRMRTGIVNRLFYGRLGDGGYDFLLRRLARSRDVRGRLRGQYAPSAWKRLLYPLASRLVSTRRDAHACAEEGCECTWCRCHRDGGAPTRG